MGTIPVPVLRLTFCLKRRRSKLGTGLREGSSTISPTATSQFFDTARSELPTRIVCRIVTMTIYFYSRTDSWGDFSNFSSHGFELDGLYWPTVEHYFQAQKFAGHPLSKQIRMARSPRMAKILGRSTTHPLRKDWDKIRDEVMSRAVRRKFQCHPELQALLISTENEKLVESAPHDYYWGCGSDGTGLNKLGQILMKIRAELQQHAPAECEDPAIVR